MIKVVIIGSGNVAYHLQTTFAENTEIQVIQLYCRHRNAHLDVANSLEITDDLTALKDADVYVIAITDGAIAALSQQLTFTDKLVVHTSGSLSMDILDPKNRRGVFYPLQTFSKRRRVNFRDVPICIESEYPDDLELLKKLAGAISNTVYPISSDQRKSLHIAAVFVSNFTNHLYKIGNDICNENHIPFEILQPLIKETAEKIVHLSPDEAQTGPAIRHDDITINSHLSSLTDENQRNIYKLLTQSIQTHGEKL